jgi:hypothetical protein
VPQLRAHDGDPIDRDAPRELNLGNHVHILAPGAVLFSGGKRVAAYPKQISTTAKARRVAKAGKQQDAPAHAQVANVPAKHAVYGVLAHAGLEACPKLCVVLCCHVQITHRTQKAHTCASVVGEVV